MGTLSSAKTLGGVGAILMLVAGFLFFLGFIGPIISIVGIILVYLGVKNISEAVNQPKIKSDFLMSIIFTIIASLVIIIGPILFLAGVAGGFTSVMMDPTNATGALGGMLAMCLIIFIIWIIFYILHAVYLKKSFDAITQTTGTGMFKTTGLVYLIGTILIFIGIGLFIIWIAQILMIVAFFSLPDQPQPVGAPGQPGAPGGDTGRICPGCGRPIPMDAQVCPYCGKDFRQQ
jgi:uncharacterized membrane protein